MLDYEVFVQFDIDHRPRPDYLDRVLGYFRTEKVAWVQAPSVCGNLDNWTARGLAEQDLIFQGPLQMGFYGATGSPFIIGSHTAVSHCRDPGEIGGFQPTRAEDHLDTVVLAAHGYTGVFVPDLIAIGDGPHDLATYLRQQFAWAYSMIQIFFGHTPRLIRRYTRGQALQFLFCQSWYTLWSISLAVLWALPAVALLVNEPIASVPIGRFLLYFLPVMLISTLMWCESRRWFQPGGVRLSWRGIVLQTARWPVVLWALDQRRAPDQALLHDHAQGEDGRWRAARDQHLRPVHRARRVPARGGLAVRRERRQRPDPRLLRARARERADGRRGARDDARHGHQADRVRPQRAAHAAVRSRALIVLALVGLVVVLGVSVAHFGHQAVHAMTAA